MEHQSALIGKVDRYTAVMRRLEHEISWERTEATRHQKRQKRYEAARQYLEDYAISAMQRRDIRKLSGQTSALKLKQSPGQLLVTDDGAVPDTYKSVTITLSKQRWVEILAQLPTETLASIADVTVQVTVLRNKVKAEIKAGADVPGADVVYPDLLEVD